MWRQDDLIMLLASRLGAAFPEEPDYEAVRAMRVAPGVIALPACPLMHGTGALISMVMLSQAGCVVILAERNYDPVKLLDTLWRERANLVVIMGDAFAKPMLRALDADTGHWDQVCINTGGEKVFPEEVDEALKTHPAVRDAVVVGVADGKWGEAITALVKLAPGHEPDSDALITHV